MINEQSLTRYDDDVEAEQPDTPTKKRRDKEKYFL